MEIQHLTKEQFIEKVSDYQTNKSIWQYKGNLPAIVDFFASWCGPCKSITPILEELAVEYKEKIVIYKVDTEKELDISSDFNIRSIPTLMFIPKSGNPTIIKGAISKKEFVEHIEKLLL